MPKCKFELISKDPANEKSLWIDRAQKIVLVKDGFDAPEGKLQVRQSPKLTDKGNTVYFATAVHDAEIEVIA